MRNDKPCAGVTAQGGYHGKSEALNNLLVTDLPPSLQARIAQIAAASAIPAAIVAVHVLTNWRPS
ncbi:hypothetical protein LMIY3S_04765 [Labrys miyagiensis]